MTAALGILIPPPLTLGTIVRLRRGYSAARTW